MTTFLILVPILVILGLAIIVFGSWGLGWARVVDAVVSLILGPVGKERRRGSKW